ELNRRWDDLNEIVSRAVQQHRTGGKADVVSFRGTTRLQLVYVDSRQIERVLLTLLSHTGHGRLNGSGEVNVATRRVTAPGDHMVIDIDDPNASDADEIGAWSGDLDACRRVLQAHGGSLEVERQGAGGVRFHMEFPITELVKKCAEWCADEMRRIGMQNVKLIPTPGNPVVYGDWLGASGAPTMLFYGHYDVQPVDPLNLWETPPFQATVRDGEIYARGSADDKGQVFMHFKAIEAHLKQTGRLPVNIKIILEGEEEVGSVNLDNFIIANKA